ncbi:MAG: hypothetical protein WC789_07775 [Lentisphaeria bacterium]|jgi:hypothetical protein
MTKLDLRVFRRGLTAWFESFHDARQGYGRYIPPADYGSATPGANQSGHFYAAADVAILRGIMGEDFSTSLTAAQRAQWVAYLNSFQDPADGSYQPLRHHSKLHANGTAVGAVGLLGGKMAHPVRLYEPFDTPEKVVPWLETAVDWSLQWPASHLFWGGIHCFSLSSHASRQWLDTVFAWLDANLDEETGWWRKGTPHADRHQGLGGAAHILPVYQHHHRAFPYPRLLLDRVLELQTANGNWHQGAGGLSYLDLDALYVYDFCKPLAGDYRAAEITASVNRFSAWLLGRFDQAWAHARGSHPHIALCLVGTLGLLRRLDPEHYVDDRAWTDIFSDRRLYRTAESEA